ncbi:MAG: rRNA maturation RNase YbeY [Leeuwenhoekiella sp.]
MTIEFNSQNDFNFLEQDSFSDWLNFTAENEDLEIGDLSYVFCSDEFLLELNKNYLDHDTLTDIITFDYCEDDVINGEIYISTERVHENAVFFDVNFDQELKRVIIHGLLHLCGYSDKSDQEKRIMRSLEESYIEWFEEQTKN